MENQELITMLEGLKVKMLSYFDHEYCPMRGLDSKDRLIKVITNMFDSLLSSAKGEEVTCGYGAYIDDVKWLLSLMQQIFFNIEQDKNFQQFAQDLFKVVINWNNNGPCDESIETFAGHLNGIYTMRMTFEALIFLGLQAERKMKNMSQYALPSLEIAGNFTKYLDSQKKEETEG